MYQPPANKEIVKCLLRHSVTPGVPKKHENKAVRRIELFTNKMIAPKQRGIVAKSQSRTFGMNLF